MNNIVQIAGKPLPVREYKGQRVVTINDIAAVHRVPSNNVRLNFKRNRKRFIQGVDYYHLRGQRVGTNCTLPPQITCVNVFTESGYLMLVKSMTDDLAWKVQRQLVNLYFRVRAVQQSEKPVKKVVDSTQNVSLLNRFGALIKDEYRTILYYRITKGLTQEETGKIMDKTIPYIQLREREMRGAGINIPSQSGCRNRLTIASTPQQMLAINS